MIIEVNEGTMCRFFMDIEDEVLELNPWLILNLNEIGTMIAYQLFDAEYDITQEILDEEINDYLSSWHEQILEKCIDVLESNGINVL